MVPSSFNESNGVLDKPASLPLDDCEPLSVRLMRSPNGYPVLVSCWKLTGEELEEMTKTGRVWLTIMGQSMPPVILSGFKPDFAESEEQTI